MAVFRHGISKIQILGVEIFPTVENILLVVAQTAQASQRWSDREDPDVSAMQDLWLAKPTTASAAPLNQIAVAGIVALLGVSYMFNSMDRQVFPALLSAIIPQYGLTLLQAGFVSTVRCSEPRGNLLSDD